MTKPNIGATVEHATSKWLRDGRVVQHEPHSDIVVVVWPHGARGGYSADELAVRQPGDGGDCPNAYRSSADVRRATIAECVAALVELKDNRPFGESAGINRAIEALESVCEST